MSSRDTTLLVSTGKVSGVELEGKVALLQPVITTALAARIATRVLRIRVFIIS